MKGGVEATSKADSLRVEPIRPLRAFPQVFAEWKDWSRSATCGSMAFKCTQTLWAFTTLQSYGRPSSSLLFFLTYLAEFDSSNMALSL